MSMFHSNTERLIDYWRARKVDRLCPARSAIDPADFTDLLPQVFILGRTEKGDYAFRLAGGLATDLHQRDLRGVDFLSLWANQDRARLAAAMEAGRRAGEPVIVVAGARTADGDLARIEFLLAPLRADGLIPDRCMGIYQPLSHLGALRGRPLGELELIRFGGSEHDERFPRLRLATVDGQRVD